METRYFKIAGYSVSLGLEDTVLWDRLDNMKPFRIADADTTILEVRQVENIGEDEPEPLLVSEDKGFPRITIGKTPSGKWFFTMAPLDNRPTSCVCSASEDFSKVEFELKERRNSVFSVNNVMMLLYALRTASLGCLEVHASVIMKEGKAVAFLGKSGTGKSTHSRMWLENIEGTELLNDDNPVIRCHADGRIIIYGSPWSGKTPCYKNLEMPLAGIVRIVQAPYNKITRLAPVQSYACLYPSVSAYRPERKIADGIHQSLSAVAASVPCFSLECLPDGDAARLSCKSIYG